MEILKSERLILRPLVPGDSADFARLLGPDPDGVRMTASLPEACTEQAAREWIRLNASPGIEHVFAVTLAESGELIGAVGFGGSPREGDLGYWIGEGYRNKGYATEAAHRIVIHASHLGVVRLFAETFPENSASSRVLTKNGFRLIGKGTRNIPKRGGLREVLEYVLEIRGCNGRDDWQE